MALAGVLYLNPEPILDGNDGREIAAAFAAFEQQIELHRRFGYDEGPATLAELQSRTGITVAPALPGAGRWEIRSGLITSGWYSSWDFTAVCAHFDEPVPQRWIELMEQRFPAQSLASGELPGRTIADQPLCDQWQPGHSVGLLIQSYTHSNPL